MTDDSYKAFLHGTMLTAMQSGNFHAVTALREAGIDRVFTDEERVSLQNANDRYSDDAMDRALMQPGMQQRYLALIADEADPPPNTTPMDLARRKQAFNDDLRRVTGVAQDLFDRRALASGTASMVSALAAERRRQQDHAWQVEAQDREIQARREDEDRRDKLKTTRVSAFFLSGDTATGLLAGVGDRADYETLGSNAYRNGDFGVLIRSFQKGTTFSAVQGDMQRNLEVAVGDQYGTSVEKAYEDWQKLRNSPGGAAAAMQYFGKFYAPMLMFHEMRVEKSIPPSIAFRRAFQDPARYASTPVPSGRAKEAKAGITAAMRALSSWSIAGRQLPGTVRNLNASSENVVERFVERKLGSLMGASNMGAKSLASDIVTNGVATGALERYGQFVIENPPQTSRLGDLLHMKDDEATAVIVGLIDSKMKQAGFDAGAAATEYEVERAKDDKGQPFLTVMATDTEGHHTALIRFSEMQAEASKLAAAKREAAERTKMHGGKKFPYNSVKTYGLFRPLCAVSMSGTRKRTRTLTGNTWNAGRTLKGLRRRPASGTSCGRQ